MSKQAPFAREDVMEAYLDSLLKEPDNPLDATARAAKLLEQATHTMAEEALADSAPEVQRTAVPEVTKERDESLSVNNSEGIHDIPSTPSIEVEQRKGTTQDTQVWEAEHDAVEIEEPIVQKVSLKDSLENRFQALFFEVAGLTLAVPLTTLGGIHQLEKIGPLFGKPDWFMGVMIHRGAKLNVIDSAKWVMPEKYDENLAQSLNYRYLIMLGDSLWGLASEKLINTVTLAKTDVKWRETTGKRPWLAGMVKEKMCALIDVDELISMLNKGLGSNDQTP